MAKEVKHTPGPWQIRRSHGLHDGEYDFAIGAAGAPVLSEAFGRSSLGDVLPAEANARLIAAAPEMLAALKECALQIAQNHGRKLTADEQAALDAARAAIARAEATP